MAFALFALCGSAASGAETASAPGKIAQLSKVIFTPAIDKQNQHIKVGTICLFAGIPVDFGAAERTVSYERFERLFAATMKKRGFNVLTKSSDLFEGEGNSAGANVLIGAKFRLLSIDMCDSFSGQKGTVTMAVEWQIYDRDKHQVVETATTQGSSQVAKFQQSGLMTMIDEAFSASLGALIDEGVVKKYLGDMTQ